jgi:hypothetical protein
MKTQFISSLLVLGSFGAFAQSGEMAFKILAVNGQVSKKDVSSEVSAAVGQKLYSGDIITINQKGYVGLVHKSGRSLELKAPGVYDVNILSSKLSNQTTQSISKKYASYVAGELTKSEEEDINKNHRKYMEVTGSVERSVAPSSIKMRIPGTSEVRWNVVSINWDAAPGTKTYVVTLTNLFNEKLGVFETTSNNVEIDLAKYKATNTKAFICQVKSKEDSRQKSPEYLLKVVSADDDARINKDIATIKEENKEGGAIANILIANYLEQNHLYLEAMKYYQMASKAEPEVLAYQEVLKDFMTRIGVSESAKQ